MIRLLLKNSGRLLLIMLLLLLLLNEEVIFLFLYQTWIGLLVIKLGISRALLRNLIKTHIKLFQLVSGIAIIGIISTFNK